MNYTHYIDVMSDGLVRACFPWSVPLALDRAEGEPVLLDGPVTWEGPLVTSVLYHLEGQLVWKETRPLAEVQAAAIDAIDSAADKVRQEVVSKQTNTEEYKRAETQAREYRAAGYPADPVPSCVASWAAAKRRDGWTGREAADDIIATADRWYALLDGIRALRLAAKEDVRHAVDGDEVAARTQQFQQDLTNLMKGTV